MLPLGEVLVSIYEKGPEILSSLYFEPSHFSISQRPFKFFRLFFHMGGAFLQVHRYGLKDWPKMPILRIGVYRGWMVKKLVGPGRLSKMLHLAKILPLQDIRVLSNGLTCPENFKCPSPFSFEANFLLNHRIIFQHQYNNSSHLFLCIPCAKLYSMVS